MKLKPEFPLFHRGSVLQKESAKVSNDFSWTQEGFRFFPATCTDSKTPRKCTFRTRRVTKFLFDVSIPSLNATRINRTDLVVNWNTNSSGHRIHAISSNSQESEQHFPVVFLEIFENSYLLICK